ncbi:MAG: PQQ-binding-like beta-propeller repeat protein, partial [Sedimentisphaerales bacterium]|nr:PQQ-binding-like beta-propeller repeat protein [Sedimentisphaerales bacterium]
MQIRTLNRRAGGRPGCVAVEGRRRRRAIVASVVVMTAVLGPRSPGADWPQWRGPSRDGVWSETGALERFASEQIPIKWRAEIGSGYSGPTVVDGRVFVTDRVKAGAEQERVHCFDATNGEALWSYVYDCEYERVGYQAGPRAAVTVADGRAYSLGTMGHLFCFDAPSGRVLWSRDLKEEYRGKVPIWGIAAAPLIEADLLIVQAGGRDDAMLWLKNLKILPAQQDILRLKSEKATLFGR